MSLPSGYTRLEYIQSSGTQYINTGFKPNSNTRVVCEFQILGLISNYSTVFGARNSGGGMGFALILSGSSFLEIYQNNYATVSMGTAAGTDRMTADMNKNVLTLNGSVSTQSAVTFSCPANLYLFAISTNGTADTFGILKLWSCTIYDNGTLVRDYIPCKNASGAVGLWDDVNSQFYGNAGTGAFTAGPEILPPAAPTGLQTVLAVVLAWEAVDGATGYKLYRDGTLIASTNGLQYVDMAVSPNETYVYSVAAVGTAGEGPAATLTVYTKSGYFEYKPLVQDATFP